MRQFRFAGSAPSGPDIDQDSLASEILEAPGFARKIRELERRHRFRGLPPSARERLLNPGGLRLAPDGPCGFGTAQLFPQRPRLVRQAVDSSSFVRSRRILT